MVGLQGTNSEIICHRRTRRNWALRDAYCPIHFIGSILEDAMEMKTCALVAKLIDDIHNDSVSDVCSYLRQWPFSVDANCWSVKRIIGVCGHPCNVKVVSDCCGV